MKKRKETDRGRSEEKGKYRRMQQGWSEKSRKGKQGRGSKEEETIRRNTDEKDNSVEKNTRKETDGETVEDEEGSEKIKKSEERTKRKKIRISPVIHQRCKTVIFGPFCV